MNKKLVNFLEHQILLCKKKLGELEPHIEGNENLATVYNKILVKKAVLVDKYKKIKFKPTVKQKLSKLLKVHKREKLICDFFQE